MIPAGRRVFVGWALCAALVSLGTRSAQIDQVARIDAIPEAPVTAGTIAGASVAIVKGRDTLVMKGYGLADLELAVPTTRSQPLTPSMPAGPCGPGAPSAPSAPAGPCGPGAPSAPSAPENLGQTNRVLNLREGETTADRMFSLETVNCLGACALAPVIVLSNEYHEAVNAGKIEKILSSYGQGEG